MTTDPRELLDQLDALHTAGTAGPWEATDPRADSGAYIDTTAIRLDDGSAPWVGHAQRHPDAALIVAAVNALPKLTASLRAVLDLADQLDREGYATWQMQDGFTDVGRVKINVATDLRVITTALSDQEES